MKLVFATSSLDVLISTREEVQILRHLPDVLSVHQGYVCHHGQPKIIYKRKRISELLMKGSTPESIGACKSLEAIDLARSQLGLVLICLPPHTTHRMQPLDRTIYGPLKVN